MKVFLQHFCLNLTVLCLNCIDILPTVFEVGDSRIQTSHALPASRI